MKHLHNYYQRYKEMNIFFLLQIVIFSSIFISLIITDKTLLIITNLFLLICTVISCYSVYRIYKNVTKHISLEAEAALYQKQQQIQKEHLKISKENRQHLEELQNVIHADLSSEKQEISDEEEAREKAQLLIDKYASLFSVDYCQNKIIDAIIYNKFQLAKSLHIRCDAQVTLPSELAFKDIDLMFLFTNLLDNAIEACEKLPEKQRYLDVEAAIKANYLSVRVRNSKDENIIINTRNMVSTKEDSENHGLGIQIIKRVCSQNKGSLKIKDQGSFVDVYATLALNKD